MELYFSLAVGCTHISSTRVQYSFTSKLNQVDITSLLVENKFCEIHRIRLWN